MFKISWDGVRLSPLWHVGHYWPIIPALDDRWVWSVWWNENWQGETEALGENLPPCYFGPPQIPHDLGSNPGSRGGKPATNRLSYGTAKKCYESFIISTSHKINITTVKSRRKHGHVTPMMEMEIYKPLLLENQKGESTWKTWA
jgi:hypothetical protein